MADMALKWSPTIIAVVIAVGNGFYMTGAHITENAISAKRL